MLHVLPVAISNSKPRTSSSEKSSSHNAAAHLYLSATLAFDESFALMLPPLLLLTRGAAAAGGAGVADRAAEMSSESACEVGDGADTIEAEPDRWDDNEGGAASCDALSTAQVEGPCDEHEGSACSCSRCGDGAAELCCGCSASSGGGLGNRGVSANCCSSKLPAGPVWVNGAGWDGTGRLCNQARPGQAR